MQPFTLTLQQPNRRYYLQVTLHAADRYHEVYKVASVRKPGQYILVQSNRPYWRYVKGLKHRRLNWQVVQGTISNITVLEKVYAAIEAQLG